MSLLLLTVSLLSPALSLLTREPPPPAPATRTTPQELWYDVRLDHFDASNTDTFPMRFYFNDEFNSSSHLLVLVGGEWAISPGWLTAGLMHETAQELGAAMVYTEHRYYGLTRPTEDTSSATLRYLSADQALGDLTQLLHYLTSDQFQLGRYSLCNLRLMAIDHPPMLLPDSKISQVQVGLAHDRFQRDFTEMTDARIGLVGCSYAGSLATWARLALPHQITAAFSDSGPLHAQEDFPEYLEVISEALERQGGAACLQSVQDAMEALTQLVSTSSGLASVSNMFGTCATLSTSPLDLATFFWFGITETFAYLVQYAVEGDIPRACAVLNDTSVDPVQRLASWVRSQPWTQPCIEARYADVVAAHTNTSYDAPDAVMRLWTYQTCVEYGWYQTTSSPRQPFLSAVPLEYFHQMCKDFFGQDFDEQLLRLGVERTNLLFGSRSLPDHVVSVAGGADPWAPMGPRVEDATALAPVYVVPELSHCRAMGRIDPSASTDLHSTQLAVKQFLLDRLRGALPSAASTPRPAAGVAALALMAAWCAVTH